MVTSKRAYTKWDLPGLLLPVPPPVEPLLTHPQQETLQYQQVVLFASPVGSLLLPSGSWCTFQDWNLFPAVPWKAYSQIPLAFKVRVPVDSQSLCWIPRLGSLTWGPNLHNSVRDFFGIIVLQLVGFLPSRQGVDFIVNTPLLPSCCSFFFVFGHGVSFFGGSQHPPVDGYSTASCDFGTLAEGDKHMSFYSTILNWKPAGGFLTTGAPEKAQAIIK